MATNPSDAGGQEQERHDREQTPEPEQTRKQTEDRGFQRRGPPALSEIERDIRKLTAVNRPPQAEASSSASASSSAATTPAPQTEEEELGYDESEKLRLVDQAF